MGGLVGCWRGSRECSFLGRSEAANTPKVAAVGLAMFDIGVALVSLLEAGLACPPVYGLGGGHWAVICWHRNFLSTLRGYGRNQDTVGG